MSQPRKRMNTMEFASVELGGVPYAIVPASLLLAVCRRARIRAIPQTGSPPSPLDATAPDHLDGAALARRIADRRKHAGLTQADLARQAGVRVETVNRIERGHVTPDFGTIRKLVQAMLDVESAPGGLPSVSRQRKE